MSAATGTVLARLADAETLWTQIDAGVLKLLRWDDQLKVLHFPQDHPLLGWTPCAVGTCRQNHRSRDNDLCQACELRHRKSGLPLAEFVGLRKPIQRAAREGPCAVPDCRRPGRTSTIRLCAGHLRQRQKARQSLEVFLARTDLVGLASFGPCGLAQRHPSPRHGDPHPERCRPGGGGVLAGRRAAGAPLIPRTRQFVSFVAREAGRLGAGPETERLKDVWDLTVFGQHSTGGAPDP